MNQTIRNIWTIARRDFRSYFTSPVAYIVIGAFLGIMGWMFFYSLQHFVTESARFAQQGQKVSITDAVVRPLYGNMAVIFLFMLPFVTMRLFAEERKLQTIQLLITSPVTLTEIILGKFFSSFLLVCVMLAMTFIYPVVLFTSTTPDPGPIFTSLLGTLLLASCYLSIGILFSAMTENQIVAGALTFGTCLFFWLISWAAMSASSTAADVLNYLSLINHFGQFGQGSINSPDVIFYLSFVGISLFLTHRILDSYRWR
ncbi:MAG: ABC transporter permease subunit [Bdellovibrionales bacterium]|nr:ABC transporter permease subunit [Bdellovibrionales bacterium]